MNKTAQTPSDIMLIAVLALLILTGIVMMAAFPILKGEISSFSEVQGDLFAERIVEKVLLDKITVNDKIVDPQQALNNNEMRQEAIRKIGENVVKEIKKAGMSNFRVLIFGKNALGERGGLFLGRSAGLDTDQDIQIKVHSTSCVAYEKDNKIEFIEVLVSPEGLNMAQDHLDWEWIRC